MPLSKWRIALNGLKTTTNADHRPRTAPDIALPPDITAQIATEVYELIMNYLVDVQSLLACMLVCRAWYPRSHHLLLRLMACRPRAMSGMFHGGAGTINCAVPYLDSEGAVIYGASDGIYLGTKDASRDRLISLRNVTHIEIFYDVNLLVCLADSELVSFPLQSLVTRTIKSLEAPRAKNLIFLTVHRSVAPGQRHRVCVLKSSTLSGVIKVFDIVRDQRGTRLTSAVELYIPMETSSVHFLTHTRVAAVLKKTVARQSAFEMINIVSAETQSLLDPSDTRLAFASKKDEVGRAIGVFGVSGNFLVCTEKMAFFIDRHGRLAEDSTKLKWKDKVASVVINGKYLFAFATECLEVWNLEDSQLVQRIKGQYRPLNDMPTAKEQLLMLDLNTHHITKVEFLNES